MFARGLLRDVDYVVVARNDRTSVNIAANIEFVPLFCFDSIQHFLDDQVNFYTRRW